MSGSPFGILEYNTAKDASEKSAEAQIRASDTAANTLLTIDERGRADTAPWREAGKNALAALYEKIKAGPGAFNLEDTPGYAFGLNEGVKTLERGAAAKGGLLSGGAQKSLIKFGQDYGETKYNAELDNFLRRYYESLTPYQSLAGIGLTSSGMAANSGANMANSLANIYQNQGNALAGSYINKANALTGVMSNQFGQANNALNNYFTWKGYQQQPTGYGGYSGGSGYSGGAGGGGGGGG